MGAVRTKQETFDIVKKHLLSQGRQSRSGTNCQYRGPNGLKCAIGVLIPDEHYKPELEGPLLGTIVNLCNTEMSRHSLYKLQRIHDEANPHTWARELKIFAEHEGLKYD